MVIIVNKDKDTLYKYYDKVITNIKTSKNLNQLSVCGKMFINHFYQVKGTVNYNTVKHNRIIYMLKMRGIRVDGLQ